MSGIPDGAKTFASVKGRKKDGAEITLYTVLSTFRKSTALNLTNQNLRFLWCRWRNEHTGEGAENAVFRRRMPGVWSGFLQEGELNKVSQTGVLLLRPVVPALPDTTEVGLFHRVVFSPLPYNGGTDVVAMLTVKSSLHVHCQIFNFFGGGGIIAFDHLFTLKAHNCLQTYFISLINKILLWYVTFCL